MIQAALFRLSFVAPLLILGLFLWATPQFVSMYQAFDAEIPKQSAFLFKWYRVLAVLPFAFLLAWWLWPTSENRGTAAFAFSCMLSVSIFGFGYWAAYAPLVLLAQQQ